MKASSTRATQPASRRTRRRPKPARSLQQAKAAADEFETLEGAKVCRACGQELTPGHWKMEKAKREQELAAATARHKKMAEAQTAAARSRDGRPRPVRSRRQGADPAPRGVSRDQEGRRAGREGRRPTDRRVPARLSVAAGRLPHEGVSRRVPADWLSTTWPTADEQRVLKKEAGELDAARSHLRTAQADQSKFDKLKAEQSAAQATLDQVKKLLPAGRPGGLRDEEARPQGRGRGAHGQGPRHQEAPAGKRAGGRAAEQGLADVQKTLGQSRFAAQRRGSDAGRSTATPSTGRASCYRRTGARRPTRPGSPSRTSGRPSWRS